MRRRGRQRVALDGQQALLAAGAVLGGAAFEGAQPFGDAVLGQAGQRLDDVVDLLAQHRVAQVEPLALVDGGPERVDEGGRGVVGGQHDEVEVGPVHLPAGAGLRPRDVVRHAVHDVAGEQHGHVLGVGGQPGDVEHLGG